MLVRMQRKGNPCPLLVGMQIGAAAVENSIGVPQNIKNSTTPRSSNSTSGYSKKKHGFEKTSALSCSLQHYLQEPRHGSNLSVHGWMSG